MQKEFAGAQLKGARGADGSFAFTKERDNLEMNKKGRDKER